MYTCVFGSIQNTNSYEDKYINITNKTRTQRERERERERERVRVWNVKHIDDRKKTDLYIKKKLLPELI